MLKQLLCCGSFLWVKIQALFNEIDLGFIHSFKVEFKRLSFLDFGEANSFKERIRDEGQFLLCGNVSSLNIKNEPECVQIALAREEGHAVPEFWENAANRPYINRFVVVCVADKKFRRSVPSCRNVVCIQGHVFSFCSRPSETEVTKLKNAAFRNENVLWLDVSMNDSVFMH